jgi:putative glutamine amidotransferase
MRPVVGITLGDDDDEKRAGVHVLREDYVHSVEQAGAVPMVLAPCLPSLAASLLDRLDGLLLSGGVDVDPALYGQPRHPKLRHVDRRRDDLELALVGEALRRDMPILAICRGIQVLNVATGGTLIQDLASEISGGKRHDRAEPRWRRTHEVDAVPDTHLRHVLGEETISVNSIHHQAVGRIGEGLAVSARCPEDGVIEGLEMPARHFVVGVQWHPESFWNRPDSFACLFEAHVEACRGVSRDALKVSHG